MTNAESKFEIIVAYDVKFKNQVASGDPNPLADFTIQVGDYDLTGASDGQFYLDDYLYFNFRKQFKAVEDIFEGKRRELTFYSIPDDLILEPTDSYLHVSLVNSRGERKNEAVPAGGVAVKKTNYLEGLINAANTFYENIIEVNPGLKDCEQMQTLQELIQNAKIILDENTE